MAPGALIYILAGLTNGAPRILSAPTCPNLEALTQAVGALAFPPAADTHTASLTTDAEGLRLTLLDGAGQILGSRSFESSDRCEDLAGAVALVLLFWENEPPGPELPAPLLPAAPADTTKVRSDVPVTTAEVASTKRPKPPPAPPHLALGLGPLGSVVSEGAAFGGTIYGVLSNNTRRFGLVLTLTGETNRTLQLKTAGATVDWSRYAVALGGQWQWHWSRITASAEADLALDIIEAQASGLAINDTILALEDPGVRLGAKVAYAPGKFRIWAGAFGVLWPVPVSLESKDVSGDGASLPEAELLFGLGIEQEVF